MIGQAQVTDPLMTALRGDRIGHAYLFSGPRGCGKTTSARILARCLNCAEGPTDTPCGTCDSCVELSRAGGGSLDVIEIDAASHNGVDDARDLRERAVSAPSRDRYKIFILDEAHMVTPQGFNALLKLVEEPPEHVKSIFATTEPDKVIGTILVLHPPLPVPPRSCWRRCSSTSRACARRRASPSSLACCRSVVRAGGGSPRDTLSILDQLIAGSKTIVRRVRARGRVRSATRTANAARRRRGGVPHPTTQEWRSPRSTASCRSGSGSAALRRRPARASARSHHHRGLHRRGRGSGAARNTDG